MLESIGYMVFSLMAFVIVFWSVANDDWQKERASAEAETQKPEQV